MFNQAHYRLVVSIHAPAGGATLRLARPQRAQGFQFTLPRGERRPSKIRACRLRGFQFTLPRGERPSGYSAGSVPERVSIHAPAGGATWDTSLDRGLALVSIHAPAGGATSIKTPLIRSEVFQFTLPRGERHPRAFILSPTRGFNSRSRGGSD